jgi:UDP-2-acetamido-3-amino-2,3-dideoxy-glucuronate N-acetyltransferase
MKENIYLHETATVDEGAIIGNHTAVWHYSHIEKTAIVGENCNLGQNTYVGNNAKIGNACRIGNSVSIFSNIELEDFVFCAPFMVFTHISFPRAAVVRHALFEKTLVRTGATIGANSTIIPGVIVGLGSFIAAGAVLTKSSKNWSLMVGVPAKQKGWVSAYGEKIPLPLKGSGNWRCTHTGDIYSLEDDNLIRKVGNIDILKYVKGKKLNRIMQL